MVDHVYGRQVHHAETKTSQKANCDVEYHERGVREHLVSADNVLMTRRAVMVHIKGLRKMRAMMYGCVVNLNIHSRE